MLNKRKGTGKKGREKEIKRKKEGEKEWEKNVREKEETGRT